MVSLRWLGVHLSLLVVSLSLVLADCPSQCKCQQRDADDLVVDCSFSDLTAVPKLPPTATEVVLRGNRVTSITNGTFQSLRLLRKLDLSNNDVISIEVGSFRHLGVLETLNLSNNKLTVNSFEDYELFRGCRNSVTDLDLGGNRLTRIPDSGLKLLKALRRISFRDNNMDNPVFGPDMKYLDVLKDVDLSGNQFSSIPPHTFTVLSSLERVNISRCGITSIAHGTSRPGNKILDDSSGIAYVTTFFSSRCIDFGSVAYNVVIDAFSNTRSLTHFDISDNRGININDLNSTINEVCKSPGLSTLRLSNLGLSDLSGILTPLINTDGIEVLDLSYNSLRYTRVDDLKPAKKARFLNLSFNQLVNLTSLSFPNLRELDVSHNKIETLREQDFDGALDLESIDLSHNKLTDFKSEIFYRNSKLITLDLSSNLISRIHDVNFMEQLQVLRISGNRITEPRELFRFLDLKSLDLSHNSIQSLENDLISQSTRLEELDLSHNQISQIASETFKSWTPPKVNLAYNKLVNMDEWGLNLINHLNLSNNKLQFINPDRALKNMRFLKELDLSYNQLTMLPPDTFTYLPGLQFLDLSYNNLGSFMQGELAPSIFPSSELALEHLRIESNNLVTLPDSLFANLLRLESLDLSRNKLTTIKRSNFNGLALLNRLDLSENPQLNFNASVLQGLVSLKTLDLSDIQWNCDCDLRDTKKWMETSDVVVVNYRGAGFYVCSQPESRRGVELSDLSLQDDECSQDVIEKKIILIIIGSTSFVILVAAAVIFWQHRWRLKKKLKKQHYRAIYEGTQTQAQGNGSAVTQGSYIHHHQHTPNLQSKIVCPDNHHHHSGQAFV